jgi:MFS family permease
MWSRWWSTLSIGRPAFGRQLWVQLFHAAGEAAFAVSLAGSLFFSVSPSAARPRVLLYLVLTLAPFAFVGPLAGPFIDRMRGGYRWVLALTCSLRAGAALAIATQLTSLFLFPLAFAVLVFGKTYSVAKSALVPRLVEEPRALVSANARLSVVSAAGGAVGAAGASTILLVATPSWVLVFAAGCYLCGALTAARLPATKHEPADSVITTLELEGRSLQRVSLGMAALRGAVGFLAFQVAFLFRAQATPPWVYGAAIVAATGGSLLGTALSGRLRRIVTEERLLLTALVVPGVVALLGGLQFSRNTAIIVAAAVGFGASTGRHAFDSLIQLLAPDADRGRTFAWFEVRFQIAWVIGALLAVGLEPGGTIAFVLLGGSLVLMAVVVTVGRRATDEHVVEPDRGIPDELLALAGALYVEGSHGLAVVNAAAAVRAAGADVRELRLMDELERRALQGRTTTDDVERALLVARRVLHGPEAK